MPESTIASTTPPSTLGQPATQQAPSTSDGFAMPEKFNGKSPEDIARAYVELEKQYGQASSKVGALDAYAKIGTPEQIIQAIEYAQMAKRAIDSGEYVPKGKIASPAKTESSKPWEADDWQYRSPSDQADAMSTYTQSQVQKYVDGIAAKYGEQIQGLAGRDAKEKSILVKAIEAARRNPNISIEELLNDAAGLAQKTPEELIDMAFQSRLQTPETRKAEIDKLVAAQVAEELQKRDAQRFTDFAKAGVPRVQMGQRGSSKVNGFSQREAENKQIAENLAKMGIDLLRN